MPAQGMPIHKFIRRPAVHANSPIVRPPVVLTPDSTLEHAPQRAGHRFEICAQNDLVLEKKKFKTVMLGMKVAMSRGVVHVSLRHELKQNRCCMLDGTIVESVDDIIVTIYNNSEANVIIPKGQTFCIVQSG